MSDCYNLLSNAELRCSDHFLNSLGMYDATVNKVGLRNAFMIAILTLPLLAVTFFSNFILLLVFISMRPRGCVHREFGLTYTIAILFSICCDNLLKSFFPHSLPWMGSPAIEYPILSHRSCKYFAFLSSFLGATRVNLLLAHCLLHIFATELRAERKSINLTVVMLNIVCILAAALMGQMSPLVHGVWTIANRFVCMPDPEWPLAIIGFYTIHEVLFCDGIAQSIVILVACFQLWQMCRRIAPTATCLRSTSESKIILFSSLTKHRLKLLRREECFRVVYVHAGLIALLKIAQGIFRLIVAFQTYGPSGRKALATVPFRETLINYNATFDLLIMCEMAVNMLHVWLIFYWQTTMRNAFLKAIWKICRPFKKIRLILMAQMYNEDEAAPQKVVEKKQGNARAAGPPTPKLDERYVEYFRLLASQMSPVKLRTLLDWLEDQPELPIELERLWDSLADDYH